MRKMAFSVGALIACVAIFPEKSLAQVQAKFSYDAIANCEKPNIRNYPIHGEGTGRLSTDRNASLDIRSSVGGRQKYNVRLGAPATEVREGSASLRVTGRHSLRAVREYPNNILVVDLRVVGTSCTLRIENRLQPGKKQYTFTTALGLAYCDKPQIVKTSCEGI